MGSGTYGKGPLDEKAAEGEAKVAKAEQQTKLADARTQRKAAGQDDIYRRQAESRAEAHDYAAALRDDLLDDEARDHLAQIRGTQAYQDTWRDEYDKVFSGEKEPYTRPTLLGELDAPAARYWDGVQKKGISNEIGPDWFAGRVTNDRILRELALVEAGEAATYTRKKNPPK